MGTPLTLRFVMIPGSTGLSTPCTSTGSAGVSPVRGGRLGAYVRAVIALTILRAEVRMRHGLTGTISASSATADHVDADGGNHWPLILPRWRVLCNFLRFLLIMK